MSSGLIINRDRRKSADKQNDKQYTHWYQLIPQSSIKVHRAQMVLTYAADMTWGLGWLKWTKKAGYLIIISFLFYLFNFLVYFTKYSWIFLRYGDIIECRRRDSNYCPCLELTNSMPSSISSCAYIYCDASSWLVTTFPKNAFHRSSANLSPNKRGYGH